MNPQQTVEQLPAEQPPTQQSPAIEPDALNILQVISSLSYRDGKLSTYLHDIAMAVSQLLRVDWSVVTYCQGETETVLASTLDLGHEAPVYQLHGTLAATVVKTGTILNAPDIETLPASVGQPPPGYRAYLGVPLRLMSGEVIGTICSFHHDCRPFTSEQICAAQLFAERAATAIDNYHLYSKLQQFNETLTQEVENRTAELQEAHAQLIQKERLAAIGEFAAMIVHEIRNPLTTIELGLTSLANSRELSEHNQKRVDFALEEEMRLKRLLEEILLYAKPHTLQHQTLDLGIFLENLIETLRDSPKFAERSLMFSGAPHSPKRSADDSPSLKSTPEVGTETSPSKNRLTDPWLIHGDPDKLKQIFLNLLENAGEAAPPGSNITCTVTCTAEPQHSREIQVSIHNQGAPIPPDVLTKLTQPFFTTKSSGNGLGLAIVQRIVDAHGGQLQIESSAMGTVAHVRLPLAIS